MSAQPSHPGRWAGPFFALGSLALGIGLLHFAAPLLMPIAIAVLLMLVWFVYRGIA